MTTVIGLVPQNKQADKVKQGLAQLGINAGQVKILAHPDAVWQQLGGHEKLRIVMRYAVIGAGLGVLLYGPVGFFAGYLDCKLMGCSQSIGATFLALGLFIGIIGGGVLGAIIGLNNLEQHLYAYVEGVRRGELLLMVDTPATLGKEVISLLRQEQGTVVRDLHPRLA
jgi:hypothetical protein